MPIGTNVLILRRLIAATGGFVVAVFAFESAFPTVGRGQLPAELAQLLAKWDAQDPGDAATLFFAMVLIWLAALATSLIGLWWTRPWARRLFSIGIAAGIPITLATPASAPALFVQTPVDVIATTVLSLLNGATLALIWLGMDEEFTQAP